MFRLDAERPIQLCDGINRRDFFHAGALAFGGLSLASFLDLKARGAVNTEKDVNCIFIMMVGAPGQHETWDMKPNAPAEIRGPYKPIKTNVPGIEIGEIFPKVARHADKFSIIRGVHYEGPAVHEFGYQANNTGRLFVGNIEAPHYGSAVAMLKGPKGAAPPHIMLPRAIGNTGNPQPKGQSAGFLGKSYDPFILNSDPSLPTFKVPDMLPPDYISSVRVDRRRRLRDLIDSSVKEFDNVADARLVNENMNQAYTLMTSARMRDAFDLSKEPEPMRDAYGRNRFGQSCLLARRMIESGVRFVSINMFDTIFGEISWDCHGSAPFCSIDGYKNLCGPMFDAAYSSLLEDLKQRGMLENTLVVATGEFGRAPKINPAGGREHWPQNWAMTMAGGGIKGGQIVGSSDEIGAYPKDRPSTTGDIAATIYKAIGLDLDTQLPGPQGRPIRLVEHGNNPINELF